MNECASLGQWIALRRKSLRLRQNELARMAACAEITLRKIEADERRPSSQLAETLAFHLTSSPDEHALFLRVALGERQARELPAPVVDVPPRAATATRPKRDNLPIPPTPLIGREDDVTALCDALSRPDVRLLTLTGAPGIGKTRLALEVAIKARDASGYADGVWFVPLASITDPALLLPAITQALSQASGAAITPESLRHFLSERRMLLFFDNFEQLLDAASEVADLLS